MSSPKPTPENQAQTRPDRSLVDTLKEQDRTVDATMDDLVDLPPDRFSTAFEKQVSALSGFSAPLRPRTDE